MYIYRDKGYTGTSCSICCEPETVLKKSLKKINFKILGEKLVHYIEIIQLRLMQASETKNPKIDILRWKNGYN